MNEQVGILNNSFLELKNEFYKAYERIGILDMELQMRLSEIHSLKCDIDLMREEHSLVKQKYVENMEAKDETLRRITWDRDEALEKNEALIKLIEQNCQSDLNPDVDKAYKLGYQTAKWDYFE